MTGALGKLTQSLVQLEAAARDAGRRQRPAMKVHNSTREPELGVQDPLGFLDPLDHHEDEASSQEYREKELKPGRLATMGGPGMLTQILVQFPGMSTCPWIRGQRRGQRLPGVP